MLKDSPRKLIYDLEPSNRASLMGLASLLCWLLIAILPSDDLSITGITLFATTCAFSVGFGIHGLRFGSGLSRWAAALSLFFALLLGILIALGAWERRHLIIYYWTGRWY